MINGSGIEDVKPPEAQRGDQTGLGRILSTPDERDKRFLLPKTTREAAEITSKYWLSKGRTLDQGATPQCVAYAAVRLLTTHPIVNKPVDPVDLYRQCQTLDEWPGESYDGTSVRALFKALKLRELVTEYRWARDAQSVLTHVLTRGPVVMGTTWTVDMFTPDRWGYIWPVGRPVGGHAWLIIGANREKANPDETRGAVRMINSWGPRWGANGRAWLSLKALQTLIDDYGEACTATEVKRV